MHKGRDGRQINTTGVRIERNDRHCVVYRGTRTALIDAGLAGPEHFPDVNRRLTWHSQGRGQLGHPAAGRGHLFSYQAQGQARPGGGRA